MGTEPARPQEGFRPWKGQKSGHPHLPLTAPRTRQSAQCPCCPGRWQRQTRPQFPQSFPGAAAGGETGAVGPGTGGGVRVREGKCHGGRKCLAGQLPNTSSHPAFFRLGSIHHVPGPVSHCSHFCPSYWAALYKVARGPLQNDSLLAS